MNGLSIKRLWNRVGNWRPALNSAEQTELLADMRRNADGSIDFFILIFLSSLIAFFGLQQNSSVVIIGAMLVAPLMSPMMAIGFAIVNGDIPLLGKAVRSTLGGMVLVIGVSAACTFFLPFDTITSEITARTAPNIIDLFIALSSGLAGAYSFGRRGLSASLPGVAIAASLVPPLCVVGFGVGLFNWSIALNALLLFTTNLSSIILAGILIFWLYGFRPNQLHNTRFFQRSVFFAILSVLLIALPLGSFTLKNGLKTQQQLAVQRILTSEIAPSLGEVEDIAIEAVEDGFVVGMTLYLYDNSAMQNRASQQIAVGDIQRQLEAAVNGSVTIRARVLPATLSIIERVGLDVQELEP